MVRNFFRRSQRIRRQVDFDRVYRDGRYAADQVLVVHADRNGEERCRLGLSVSRKVGGAITRNRWKRLIREAFRTSQSRLPVGLDMVVRPRRGATADYQAICDSLASLAQQVERKLARIPVNDETSR